MPIESPAKPPQFVAVKSIVLQGIRSLGEPRVVARAISKTMAKRIANALNHHQPNREGV